MLIYSYVILETVIPVVTPAPPVQNTPIASILPVTPTPAAVLAAQQQSLPLNANTPTKLQFKLSAKDLANKDKTGASDPFVEVLYTEGESSKQKKLGISEIIQDNNNPVWTKVFEFQYDPAKNQVNF